MARGKHDVEVVLRLDLLVQRKVQKTADQHENRERGDPEGQRERRGQRAAAHHAASFTSST